MFGRKTPMPCNNCLELSHYESSQTMSKSLWMQVHQNMLQHAKRGPYKRSTKAPREVQDVWEVSHCQ